LMPFQLSREKLQINRSATSWQENKVEIQRQDPAVHTLLSHDFPRYSILTAFSRCNTASLCCIISMYIHDVQWRWLLLLLLFIRR
jgi:hypothetical protein